MSAGEVDDANGTDASVAAYLDERAVLDLLASLDNGFASVETVTVSSAINTRRETNVSGEVGVSGWLSGLGKIGFGASRKSGDGTDASTGTETARYHTSGSLLHQLRRHMESRQILMHAATDQEFATLKASDFVEIRGTFLPNPFIHPLETYVRLLDLVGGTKVQTPGSGGAASSRRAGNDQTTKPAKRQESTPLENLQRFLAHLQEDRSQMMMLKTVEMADYSIITAIDTQHLQMSSLNELYDGEYRVLAQILRHQPEGASGALNLLRGSAVGEMGKAELRPIVDSITQRIEAENWEMREPNPFIDPPFLRIRPVAIYP